MRVTAAISHPHPAEYVSQLIFVSAVSLGDFPRTLRKWRLTCIHTQQYKLLHYYKNCVLILMRVTAAISHPHPAEYVSQLIFVSAVSLGDFPRTLRKWKADVYPHTAV